MLNKAMLAYLFGNALHFRGMQNPGENKASKAIIRLNELRVEGGRVEARYTVPLNLKRFVSPESTLALEYSEDVSSVPLSVLSIPFVANIIPLAWLLDAELVVDELDERFYNNLPKIKKGYMDISPDLNFRGGIRVGKLVNNEYESTGGCACLFSGGADALSLVLAHVAAKPVLLTLLGADVSPQNENAIAFMRKQTVGTAGLYGLPTPAFVRTNMRDLLERKELEEYFRSKVQGFNWWHDIQHGIGIISHAAPLAWLHRWQIVYIASTFSNGRKVRIASDPLIDDHVKLAATDVVHDQYSMSRQDKIRFIVQSAVKPPLLHVCFSAYQKTYECANCCRCEKCLRTIFGLLAEGGDPSMYGFDAWRSKIGFAKATARAALTIDVGTRYFWEDVRARFLETGACRQDPLVKWIYENDALKPMSHLERLRNKIHGRLKWLKYRLCMLYNHLCHR